MKNYQEGYEKMSRGGGFTFFGTLMPTITTSDAQRWNLPLRAYKGCQHPNLQQLQVQQGIDIKRQIQLAKKQLRAYPYQHRLWILAVGLVAYDQQRGNKLRAR